MEFKRNLAGDETLQLTPARSAAKGPSDHFAHLRALALHQNADAEDSSRRKHTYEGC